MGTRQVKLAIKRAKAQVERELSEHVREQNRKDAETESDVSITGASYLAETVRDRIARAKKSIADANERVMSAADQIGTAADGAQAVAAAIEQEAADLQAQLAQLTNGPPSPKE